MEFIIGIILFALAVWALINIWGSAGTVVAKLLWTLLVLIFPLVGVIIWYFAGPKSARI